MKKKHWNFSYIRDQNKNCLTELDNVFSGALIANWKQFKKQFFYIKQHCKNWPENVCRRSIYFNFFFI